MPDVIYTARANAGKNEMGFFHGSANAGALILMFCAWLLLNAPEHGERVWPYLVFGAIFVVLLADVIHIVMEEAFAYFLALMQGVPLAIAGYWLGSTPYRWLEYSCWAFAAVYAILLPRAIHAAARMELKAPAPAAPGARSDFRPTARRAVFDPENVAIAMLIVVGVSGLIMGTGLVTRQWGLLAGAAAFVLWPLTLAAVPWYAGLVHEDWFMLAVVYGGGTAGALLYLRSNPEDTRGFRY